ncbi:heparan sulfate 2-O-sulfotransferase 1-like [Saccoglossus kowalevskii]|uniref:Heparan sulfate 2-O-sulfotransferase pipe-like n=1 Tax=Saccoglossus kowalevskii TaxID=10224 RepID=A0ABM0GT75_SACKO|nr:PREDICTED: heparan sulfate 2-O-sulfotransferase pipe-like [Saccoglossus kowalevskii]
MGTRRIMTMIAGALLISIFMNISMFFTVIRQDQLNTLNVDPYNDTEDKKLEESQYSNMVRNFARSNTKVSDLVRYGKSFHDATITRMRSVLNYRDWKWDANNQINQLYQLLYTTKNKHNTTLNKVYDLYDQFKANFWAQKPQEIERTSSVINTDEDEVVKERFVEAMENFTMTEVIDDDDEDYDEEPPVSRKIAKPMKTLPTVSIMPDSRTLQFPVSINPNTGFPIDITQYWNESRVVYNCVDQCGSQSVLAVIGILSFEHNFRSIWNRVRRYNLTTKRQEAAVTNINTRLPPYVFNRHIYYLDFDLFGIHNPTYINLIREPLPRFLSWYYTHKINEPKVSGTRMYEPLNTLSFDECVLTNNKVCSEKNAFQVIPYFCGHSPDCQLPSRWALEMAKKHVVEKYAFVGVLEDLDSSLRIFEILMPQFFESASKVYKTMVMGLKKYEFYKTVPTPTPSDAAIRLMSERLELEYQFYSFVRTRMELLKKQLLLSPNFK